LTWGLAEEKDSVVFDEEEELPLEVAPDPLPDLLLPEEKSPPRRPWGLLKTEESQEERPTRRRVRNMSDPDSRLFKPPPFMATSVFSRDRSRFPPDSSVPHTPHALPKRLASPKIQ
jgi:hypothetical protein